MCLGKTSVCSPLKSLDGKCINNNPQKIFTVQCPEGHGSFVTCVLLKSVT